MIALVWAIGLLISAQFTVKSDLLRCAVAKPKASSSPEADAAC